MIAAAENLEFEKAALLRDQIRELKRSVGEKTEPSPHPVKYGKSRKGRAKSY